MRENRFIRQKFLVRKSGGRPPEVGVQAGSPPSREFTCTSIRNPAGFCNFSPAFSTAQAIIRGKTGRPEKHLFRRRQSHRPRDADLAGEMPVVGDDEQRSPIPCNGAGKDAEAPEVEVVGRFVEDKQVGNRVRDHQAAQAEPHPLAAAQRVATLVPHGLGEQGPVEPHLQPVFGQAAGVMALRQFQHAPRGGRHAVFLVEPHMGERRAHDLPRGGLQLPRQ